MEARLSPETNKEFKTPATDENLIFSADFKNAQDDDELHFSQDIDGVWWFREKIHKYWGQSIRVDGFQLYQRTDFQTLVVFYNTELGHVMLLDGAVQIAENNWHEYQETLVASTILPQYDDPTLPIEVLVIGGGDGGVATVARKLFPQANVTMVEIDEGVVNAAKKYFPVISESLRVDNPKFKLIIGDGIKYVSDPKNHHRFAAAIIDCTDPSPGGPAVGLFGTTFQENLKQCLKKNGIVLQQSGTLEMQLGEVQGTVDMMAKLYKHAFVLLVTQVTYPGKMALVGGSDFNIRNLDEAMLEERFSVVFNLGKLTKHFNPRVFLNGINNLPQEHQLWLDPMLASSPLLLQSGQEQKDDKAITQTGLEQIALNFHNTAVTQLKFIADEKTGIKISNPFAKNHLETIIASLDKAMEARDHGAVVATIIDVTQRCKIAGNHFFNLKNYLAAITYYRLALDCLKNHSLPSFQRWHCFTTRLILYSNLMNAYNKRDDFASALLCADEAEKLFLSDETHTNIASINKIKYQKALAMVKKCNKFSTEKDFDKDVLDTLLSQTKQLILDIAINSQIVAQELTDKLSVTSPVIESEATLSLA